MRMEVPFSHLSRWLWNGKHQEPRIPNGSPINCSAETVLLELDVLRFPLVKQASMPSSSKRVKRKWHSREERKIDREYDVVIVPSDGACDSVSESDESDWSIGWLEPHGTGFSSDNDKSHETDNSFAVLVPCYRRNYGAMVVEDPKSNLLSNIGYFPHGYSDGSKEYVENWISSLRHT